MNGYKNKICKYAADKRLLSHLKIQIENEGMEKVIPCKWKSKEIQDNKTYFRKKIDFNIKTVKRDKEGHCNQFQKNVTIVNIYPPNIGGPQYMREMLIAVKGYIYILLY